jgi:30S ribosomal protein S31
MGKGDKRSKRGKIFAGSYGKTRPKRTKKNTPPAEGKESGGKKE